LCILRFSIYMQKLLSLPENLVSVFHKVTDNKPENWFVLSDPEGCGIGSGGGTAWLLAEHRKSGKNISFEQYLAAEKKIIIHAGGQSRRLPAYAPAGKVLAPIPVFRWSRGQRLDQTLLDLQVPLFEKIMEVSGTGQNTLIASGDVLILSPDVPFELPVADVVCFGIWVDPHLASRHGVFFSPRINPQQLDFMLQKPDHARIESLASSHLFLMDIGIWVLSDNAVELLMKRCGWQGTGFANEMPAYYDLYGTFGTLLGKNPAGNDHEVNRLTAAILPMNKGEFYHYGTSRELISSTEKIQNRVQDQRSIWHYRVKPHPSLFVQNAFTDISWSEQHHHIWIENSHVPSTWGLNRDHVITGVPENDWDLNLAPGICLDIIPVGEAEFCIRPYGIDDAFRGKLQEDSTLWMGKPFKAWLEERDLSFAGCGLDGKGDIQAAPLFPLLKRSGITAELIQWMTGPEVLSGQGSPWLNSIRISAGEISSRANLMRLIRQRESFRKKNLGKLASNYKRSVFYQSDLKEAAREFARDDLVLPGLLPQSEPAMLRFRDHMFRSEVMRLKGLNGALEETNAFRVLQSSITNSLTHQSIPRRNVFSDQIVWGRSPARLDLAGGWSDTPPYCLQNGGSVLNLAVELNGQPPIQVYIRNCTENKIILRSIDNGVSEEISTFNELKAYQQVGSSFSIPKAALCLAGFHPDYCGYHFKSLEAQLAELGGGFEISLLAAIPKGSGLGTSSILAATVLGSLSDFCGLEWDHQAICHRTLILEQLLTTGGGWQDQYGGILPGIKLLESEPGAQEKMSVHWMPDRLFTHPEYKDRWLLYYTGITRIAKNILAEIVRGMFLNEGNRLRILDEIRQHAYHLADAIQRSDFEFTGRMVAHSWKLNKALDHGTNTPEVQYIINQIEDQVIGLKLVGAGGGGYMVICAKDPVAAIRIQSLLRDNPPNSRARFVKMEVSQRGFQTSRS
jgi:galactokinase/mevalonate kinase-like predicted kinase